MRHLFAPFIWLDRLVQKAVDAFVFFLMRRFGVRKSTIVYVAIIPIIFSLLMAAWAGIGINRIDKKIEAIGLIVLAPFFCIGQVRERRRIARCEERGMDDRIRGQLFFLKGLASLYLMVNLYNLSVRGKATILPEHFYVMTWSFLLLLFYISNTPNTPPAQKQTASDLASDAA